MAAVFFCLDAVAKLRTGCFQFVILPRLPVMAYDFLYATKIVKKLLTFQTFSDIIASRLGTMRIVSLELIYMEEHYHEIHMGRF